MNPRPDRKLHIRAGAVINGLYEVGARIGVGGMASVFEATSIDSGERVAIKVIDLGDEDITDIRRRFFNELLLATRVKHPNIVDVHDFGLLGGSGSPYIVMELLRGETLHRRLRQRGRLTSEEAIPLFLGALSALRVAHEMGVVHQDLKPSNLFLCSNSGEVSLVVLDFGVASRESGRVISEEFHGTPRYSAPEYLHRQVVSPAVDVYQMGLVLCEALTGEPVVADRDPSACMKRHLDGDLEIPESLRLTRLGAVLERAVAHDPAHRFPNAGELHEALSEAFDGEMSPSVRHTEPPALVRTRLREKQTRLRAHATSSTPDDATVVWNPGSTKLPPERPTTKPLQLIAATSAAFLLGVLGTWLIMRGG